MLTSVENCADLRERKMSGCFSGRPATLDNVLSMFEDDPNCLAILMGRVDGSTVAEMCEVAEISRVEYEAASKRLQRKLLGAIAVGEIQCP